MILWLGGAELGTNNRVLIIRNVGIMISSMSFVSMIFWQTNVLKSTPHRLNYTWTQC